MIIGIAGRKGSGKDTVGSMIKDLTPQVDWEIRKYADKLKDMVCVLLDCTREDLENPEFKESPIGEKWVVYQEMQHGIAGDIPRGPLYASKEAYDNDEINKNFRSSMNWVRETKLTPRLILQLLGTNVIRNTVHPDSWVLSLFSQYKPKSSNWLVTDVRFKNEAEAIKGRGGILINIERKNLASDDSHVSETGLDDYQGFDYTIYNCKKLSDLKDKVTRLCDELNLTKNKSVWY